MDEAKIGAFEKGITIRRGEKNFLKIELNTDGWGRQQAEECRAASWEVCLQCSTRGDWPEGDNIVCRTMIGRDGYTATVAKREDSQCNILAKLVEKNPVCLRGEYKVD